VQNYCCLRFAGDPCHPLKIYFTTDYISNIDEVIHHFDLPLKDILLTASKIITKNNDEDFNLNILDSIDLSFLNTPNQKYITLISESLTSFDSIVKATTIQLWHTNLQKNRETEASQKLTAKLTSERVLSATVATTKAILNAVNNIEESNAENQATQLQILNLEKQLLQQKQTPNEIINHIKRQKNAHGSHPGSMTSLSPFPPKSEEIVDLTMTHSQCPQQARSTHSKFKRRKTIHWDETHHIKQYNPVSTPLQTFGTSHTLHTPQNSTSKNTQSINPFNYMPTPPPKKPFHVTPNKSPRGGRNRGRGRGNLRN
jgi:hypothetical protein